MSTAQAPTLELWRGMRDLETAEGFMRRGGAELAPMSTTSDLRLALAYALSGSSLIFKIHSTSFMTRGADISFLSAFPAEQEYLFPPLTFLKPTGRHEEISVTAKELGVSADHHSLRWMAAGRTGSGMAGVAHACTHLASDENTTLKFTVIEVEPHLA